MRKTIAISILGLLALCLLVVGCGGGGDSAEAQEIDKATFVKKAEAICEKASGQILAQIKAIFSREAGKPQGNPTREDERLKVVFAKTAFIPGLNSELKEIRALGIPDEGRKEAQAFVDAVQKGVEKAEADPKAFMYAEYPLEDVELTGRRYGIGTCPLAAIGGETS